MKVKDKTVLVRLSELHRELAKQISKFEKVNINEAINKCIEVYCKTHHSELYENFKKYWHTANVKEKEGIINKSVYLISNPIDSTIKIGITSDIDRRLYQLQREYNNKYLCVSKVYIGSKKDEDFLKNRFLNKQAYGEFFYLNARDLYFIDNYFNNQNN